MFLLFMELIGCPLSWHKNVLNPTNSWVGYMVDINSNLAWLPEDKMSVFAGGIRHLADGKPCDHDWVESMLGRFQWACKAYPLMNPFLAPLYAWCSKMQPEAKLKPGKLVRYLAHLMLSVLDSDLVPVFPDSKLEVAWGASDAGASDSKATVGGWFSFKPNPKQSEVFWYAYSLTPSSAPWAFDKVSPKRRISALELLGTILLAKFSAKRLGARALGVTLSANTDNQGNSFSLAKKSAKAWPNSALMMELAAHEIHTGARCQVSHVKRASNVWADDLTNGKFQNFCKDLRETTPFEELSFFVFDQLQAIEVAERSSTPCETAVQSSAAATCPGVASGTLTGQQPAATPTARKRRRVTSRD